MPDDTATIDPATATAIGDTANLPAQHREFDDTPQVQGLAEYSAFTVASLPLSLQIFFNPVLNERCKDVARYLSKADGFAPRHLIGKPEACFAVVSRALTWRLDPYAVAQATYQTPGGQVGYFGSLCQAIIENSGRLIGGVKYEHFGDWNKLRGKFRIATSEKNTKYPVATWKPEDEFDIGVIVRAHLKDEDLPREMPFDLVQAFPRNSTLWATDPRTQIQYTAVRRFGNSVVPTLFMGVPFDHGEFDDWAASLKDVTPGLAARPELSEYGADNPEPRGRSRSRSRAQPEQTHPEQGQADVAAEGGNPATSEAATGGSEPEPPAEDKPYAFTDSDGVVYEFAGLPEAVTAYSELLDASADDETKLEAAWHNGEGLMSTLRKRGHEKPADALDTQFGQLRDRLRFSQTEQTEQTDQGQTDQGQTDQGQTEQTGAEGGQPAAVEEGQPGGQPAQASEPAPASQSAQQPDPKDEAVRVPPEAGAQAWFQPARAKLRAMAEASEPPEEFRRFRTVNATQLEQLKREVRSWYAMLDKIILAGERAG
jgi:hypothetical protein